MFICSFWYVSFLFSFFLNYFSFIFYFFYFFFYFALSCPLSTRFLLGLFSSSFLAGLLFESFPNPRSRFVELIPLSCSCLFFMTSLGFLFVLTVPCLSSGLFQVLLGSLFVACAWPLHTVLPDLQRQ